MKNVIMPLTTSRVIEIGHYLAEFAVDFVPIEADISAYNSNDFFSLIDTWYENFIRYAETNHLVSRDEIFALRENFYGLDVFIKEAAIDAAADTFVAKAKVFRA
jgi:hypothetical protein